MRPGDRIKIRDAEGGRWWGLVTHVDSQTEMIDVTIGGLTPGGPPPDTYRRFAPGKTSVTLTVELQGPR
jgi:hypothetical protein